MGLMLRLGGSAVAAGLALGLLACSTEVSVDDASVDGLVAPPLPAAQNLSVFADSLAYGESVSFSYSKRQTQQLPSYAFAVRLLTAAQDTVRLSAEGAGPGSLYLVDRSNGRHVAVASSSTKEAKAMLELSFPVLGNQELWGVYVPLSGSASFASTTLTLGATPGAPWTPGYAVAVREALMGADNAQSPWSKLVSTRAAAKLIDFPALEGTAKLRYAQLAARNGMPPEVFRWNFQGREILALQSASSLNGTLDLYLSGGRWVTGARLRRGSYADDISKGLIEWTSP